MQNLFKILKTQFGLSPENETIKAELQEMLRPALVEMDQDTLLYKEVLHNLEAKQIYLDSKLSLTKFSSIIGTNTTYLSNAINKHFGCNFKTLVNKYRVEYSKKQLSEHPAMSVKEISKSCGFSSTSAFYASFKRVTGISPLQYRMLAVYNNLLFKRDNMLKATVETKGEISE